MKADPAYLDLLDTILNLRSKLSEEETTVLKCKVRIHKLVYDLERCERYITYLENNLVSHEDEIERLKIELNNCRDHLDLKEEVLVAQDERIIQLETTIDDLKKQILKLSRFQNHGSKKADQESMSLPDLIQNIAVALDHVERGIGGDRSVNPINIINNIRLSITTVRLEYERIQTQNDQFQFMLDTANQQIARLVYSHQDDIRTWQRRFNNESEDHVKSQTIIQRLDDHITNINRINKARINTLLQEKFAFQLIIRRNKAEADLAEFNQAWAFNKYQKWKARELISRQNIFILQNNPLNMANMVEVNQLLMPQLAVLPYYDGQEDPDSYYAKLRNINESARPLAVAGFNAAARAEIMKGKMTGRFHPVPATNLYNGGANINSEAEFLNWLKGKYQEVMVGTNRDALRALANEKFTPMDTVDTYEKRIKPYTLGIPYNDALPYLYEHMPNYIEIRLRQVNPGDLDAFFTNLRKIWLESRGRNDGGSNQPSSTPIVTVQQPVKDDFKLRLARDLQYAGVATDDVSLEKFIYDELTKRLTKSASHIRRSPFEPKNTYATKKGIKKITKIIRRCSACGKTGHTKVNCSATGKGKRVKKVNYVCQNDADDPSFSDDEYIEESVIVDDSDDNDDEEEDEYDDNNESQNCYAIKKNWN
jgi:hypothetical protein